MSRLFGTDGIRGRANQYPITPEVAMAAGRAAVYCLGKDKKRRVVIGRDPRESGAWLMRAVSAGVRASGGSVQVMDVLPTPGVAHITRINEKACAGIMISASHNPYQDNGIKFFNGNGVKLSDDQEHEIERHILSGLAEKTGPGEIGEGEGTFPETTDPPNIEGNDSYTTFLLAAWASEQNLEGKKIVLDCANGATYRVASTVFSSLDADLTVLFDHPDGKNINRDCGSQHPEILAKTVVSQKADIGLAFDGDGDRLIAVDELGRILTGDRILAVLARAMKSGGQLTNNTVVTTIMSNQGFGWAMSDLNINHRVAGVGDRKVMAEMIASGAMLGGEDSGHCILRRFHTTGDGILTGLKLAEVVVGAGKPLSELVDVMRVYPQVMINVDVAEKPPIETIPAIVAAIQKAESRLGDEGRVLVRYSGTQDKCRVMVEGPSAVVTKKICHEISDVIQQVIGRQKSP